MVELNIQEMCEDLKEWNGVIPIYSNGKDIKDCESQHVLHTKFYKVEFDLKDDTFIVNWIEIFAHARGKGLGKDLIKTLINSVREQNLQYFEMATVTSVENRRICESLGFHKSGRSYILEL